MVERVVIVGSGEDRALKAQEGANLLLSFNFVKGILFVVFFYILNYAISYIMKTDMGIVSYVFFATYLIGSLYLLFTSFLLLFSSLSKFNKLIFSCVVSFPLSYFIFSYGSDFGWFGTNVAGLIFVTGILFLMIFKLSSVAVNNEKVENIVNILIMLFLVSLLVMIFISSSVDVVRIAGYMSDSHYIKYGKYCEHIFINFLNSLISFSQ